MKFGIDGRVFYITTARATWGTATDGINSGVAPVGLTEMNSIANVTLNLGSKESDVTTRAGNGWELSAAVLKTASIDITMPHQPTDAGYIAIMKAYLTRATIAMAILDGDDAVVGSQGMWADFAVIDANREEPIDGVQQIKFTIKPGLSAVGPEWVKVAAA